MTTNDASQPAAARPAGSASGPASSGRGVFVTFEGVEGSGKSTQMELLARRLEEGGVAVAQLREPGGTRVGEAIRYLLLDPANHDLDPRAELLLYEASRAQLVAERIEPVLRAGQTVLCDRFFDSTTAYQGYARGLSLEEIRELNRAATGGLVPDLTVLLDIDPAHGIERARRASAAPDRLENEGADFHSSVREGFLAIARLEPDRVVVVDGEGSAEDVAERVLAAVRGSGLFRGALSG